ncbi:hypothetical protein [Paenibacillus glycinis]|uniref:MerR family transcriptional regulator n=1 Tax=Paenibacillus glycinis TaxID=2697035 RepID=A0ABW9XSG5_9BACL|nr:hypothetical protein [Paenibacillus glycinis]NBD25612.1 hypothetical protein [Paenibacillus glycinis]
MNTYKIEQVARFFGVNDATIITWLKVGRIIDAYLPSDNMQCQIQETAMYKSISKDIPINEIVELYEIEQKRTSLRPMTLAQEQQEILDVISFFETKYGGTYEETLFNRESELTLLEKRDMEEWAYLLSINKLN